jgi:hypothetical protein
MDTITTRDAARNSISSWRQILRVHPAAELFPLLGKDDLHALAQDIKAHGLRQAVSIIEDEHGKPVLLDGRNRLDALELLGEDISIQNPLIFDLPPSKIDDVFAFVISANVHRRHLTGEQKREPIGKLLEDNPEKSNLQIAKAVKADDKTVAAVRKEKERRSEIPTVRIRTDTKGRKQSVAAASKKASNRLSIHVRNRHLKIENQKLRDEVASLKEEGVSEIPPGPEKRIGDLPTGSGSPEIPFQQAEVVESNPIVTAWDNANDKKRREFVRARKIEIMKVQQQFGKFALDVADDDGLDIPVNLRRVQKGEAAS